MGRKRDRGQQGPRDDSEFERTMADAEADLETGGDTSEASSVCICGSNEFLLEAYLHVIDGRMRPEPVDVEGLTCPACGREYEAVMLDGGRIARGEFQGWADLDED